MPMKISIAALAITLAAPLAAQQAVPPFTVQ